HHLLVDRILPTTHAETLHLTRKTLGSGIFQGFQKNVIFALFLGSCPSKRVGGDVAERSKALPC
ncbi:hypothetical protein, partial [Sagittula salina]